ncbi:MAG TPA: sulfotransferase, partial [Gammaproteobacteria bacterium]|nr:sulfotransferase [Gammaproteobacteria bacterium]
KVLLTVRDPGEWFDSTQTTIFSPLMRARVGDSPAAEFLEKTVWGDFGDRLHDRDYMIAAFERHTAEVKSAIPRERLLVLDVKQGWKPLCDFLGVAIPSKPLPKLNSREELGARITATREKGGEQDFLANAKRYVAELSKLSE